MNSKKRNKNIFVSLFDYFRFDIWRISTEKLSKPKSFLIKTFRIIALAVRGFFEDKVNLRASALTYYTLLSTVPVAAMGFAVAKGFGLDKVLERQIEKSLSGQEDIVNWVIQFAKNLLENTKSGWIAGIGVLILFWAVINVLSNIESSFNSIWEIKKGRGITRKFADYLSITLIAPLLVIISSSLSVSITAKIGYMAENSSFISYIGPFLFFLIRFAPFIMIWILLVIIYIVMPNTRVKFVPALVGAIVAGTAFQFVQWFYINFQMGVSKYNAIYGGFAALPLFLIWLNISWIIILFGAELSFATQNVQQYEFEPDSKNISFGLKRLISLLIANLVVKNFEAGKEPLNSSEISSILKIPIKVVKDVLFTLTECNVFIEIQSDKSKERKYLPALGIDNISVDFVLNKIENYGRTTINISETNEYTVISKKLMNFNRLISNSPDNVLLKEIG